MRLVLMGAPGAGKGTVARLLSERWGIPHISSGDLFRWEVRAGSELGEQAQGYMQRGELVPDDLVLAMMRKRLTQADAQAGYVLDGFPRTEGQAQALERVLDEVNGQVQAVLDLRVPEQELVRRLCSRRVCPECEAIYNLETMPPRQAGRCDRCGAGLIQREDDRPQAVRTRLAVYQRQTEPLLAYYGARGLLHAVDGSGGASHVAAQAERIIRGER